MTAAEMLKKAGYPDTESGRKAFYKKYPTQDSFMKKFAKGGDTELAFPQQPDSNQFFNMGTPATFPGPYYAHGGSHMPLVHYEMAGAVPPQGAMNPQMMGAMMDNQGGNIPLATRQPGGAPIEQLPRFENGGMDPKSMAEQLLTIRNQYESMTKRQLKKELEDIQESLSTPYQNEDPSLAMRQAVITELLGEGAPMAQTGGIAFPQQPAENQFFTGAHFNNQYRKGGMPCYNCGGSYDAGGNTPFNYGYFPMSMAIGGDIGLDTTDNTDYLTYAAGGESPQGFTMGDYRNAQNNEFKDFLSNTSQAYQAGQVMQQGQMEGQMPQLPQNAMGGYDAMMPGFNMQYGNQYNTDAFSQINPMAYGNIQAQQNALDNLTKEGAGQNFMGNLYNLMAAKNQQKQQQAAANKQAEELMKKDKTKAKYGYFLPKHQTPPGQNNAGTNTATNTGAGTGAGTTPTYLTKDDLTKWWEETQKKNTQQGNQQTNQGFYNPYFQTYQPAGFGFMGAPTGSRYKIKIKGHGTMPFYGTDGTTTQGQGAGAGMPAGMMQGMSPENLAKYMEAMNKSGFKGEYSEKSGLLGKWLGPKKRTFSWSFGNPANPTPPVQGPLNKPGAGTTTNTKNQQPTSNLSPEIQKQIQQGNQMPVKPSFQDFMSTQVSPYTNANISQNQDDAFPLERDPSTLVGPREQQAYGGNIYNYGGSYYNQGGSYGDDVVWMDEDDIRKFEAGGGVLEYLDGGQFKQYY